MTNLQATPAAPPSRPRRRLVGIAAAVIALATLAGCGPGASGVQPGGTNTGPGTSPVRTTTSSPTVAAKPPKPQPGPRRPGPCAVSAILVNSCRPWVGAAANGNPAGGNGLVPQFLYLERLLGHHLDIFRDYNNTSGKGEVGALPLNSDEMYFARQPGTFLDVNWKPASNWAQADGGDPAVNANIKKAADSIKAIAPHKIFLTIWVEPQHAVSGGSDCPGLDGKAGTPAQYKQMWQNVESIFRAQDADNVVWTMDYMSYPKWDCLVPQLWPGNNLVDWVIYDSYDHDDRAGSNWSNTVGRFYQLLEHDSSPSVDFDAKPWGLGEFNTCQNGSEANTQQYFLQAKQAIDSDAYPRLKMYNIYASTAGGTVSKGCLTDYTPSGQPDPAKNSLIKSLFDSPVFNR